MSARLLYPLLPVLALLSAGCPGTSGVSALLVAEVDAVVVQSLPAAVNWDGRPGPDGLEVRVFLFQAQRPSPVTVTGTLEFSLYEGALSAEKLAQAQPVQTWVFSAAELAAARRQSAVGWGYVLRLPWQRAPAANAITLVTRYRSPAGRVVEARPFALGVGGPTAANAL